MTPPKNLSLLANEQFRIRQLQAFNWGTFSGIHTIPIAERGFLFVGRSGTGKSTLLDAFSALLAPPRWLILMQQRERLIVLGVIVIW